MTALEIYKKKEKKEGKITKIRKKDKFTIGRKKRCYKKENHEQNG